MPVASGPPLDASERAGPTMPNIATVQSEGPESDELTLDEYMVARQLGLTCPPCPSSKYHIVVTSRHEYKLIAQGDCMQLSKSLESWAELPI
jgi:hypothetical protein